MMYIILSLRNTILLVVMAHCTVVVVGALGIIGGAFVFLLVGFMGRVMVVGVVLLVEVEIL